MHKWRAFVVNESTRVVGECIPGAWCLCQLAYIFCHMATAPATLAETPDLAAVRAQLSARTRAEHFYVALLGLRDYRPVRIYAQLQKGLAYGAFERFQRNTRLSAATVAELIQLPLRTLARRKQAGRLQPDESDRLARVARVFGRALGLFEGDPEAARHWLSSKQPLLGNLVPLELAGTDVGASEVEHLIGRIEHGIPA
jgi:putative toxin-antitoxin system antitoxin component (TIGR02293 family)